MDIFNDLAKKLIASALEAAAIPNFCNFAMVPLTFFWASEFRLLNVLTFDIIILKASPASWMETPDAAVSCARPLNVFLRVSTSSPALPKPVLICFVVSSTWTAISKRAFEIFNRAIVPTIPNATAPAPAF